MSIQCEDVFCSSFRRSSGLSFYADISDRVWLPVGLGEHLGSMDYEVVRIVVLIMGDVFRYSLATGGSSCPFCPVELHTQHLFLCPNCPFRDSLPEWNAIIRAGQISDWVSFVRLLLTGLLAWQTHTVFFQPVSKNRVSGFFGQDLGH